MSEFEKPNQSERSEHHTDYLRRAAEACAAGDYVLGMHLYLAAYEKAMADPNIPDGMELSGLREAWHLACSLKERSMAEYVFEKLEPYLTHDEIAMCASKLQNLALDKLEEYGFSREELENVAQMISHDLTDSDASVVKVESISIPGLGTFDVEGMRTHSTSQDETDQTDDRTQQATNDMQGAETGNAVDSHQDSETPDLPESTEEPESDVGTHAASGPTPKLNGTERPEHAGIDLANAEDFNPYDQYRDYSIGKSWHCATNEGSGAEVFTRDEERAAAHERFLAEKRSETPSVDEQPRQEGTELSDQADIAAMPAAPEDAGQAGDAIDVMETEATDASETASADAATTTASGNPLIVVPSVEAAISAINGTEPQQTTPDGAGELNYRSLTGYDEVISVVREYGVGLHNDRAFKEFVAMLNDRHGLVRSPALDTLLFRSAVIEDATRFVEATIGEIGLPSLRMSMEESAQGIPVLCVITQGNHRPRMNHANNRFESPAILVLDNLDTWYMPEPPENVEGMAGFVMANISRGAREAVNLIQAAVENPDVYVLATATTAGEVDPFFYDLIEPLTIIDINNPNDKERVDIWTEIAQNHPSMRTISRSDLMRYSRGLSRFDIYMAARDAIEDAYKMGLVRREFIPVSNQNIFEKLAACHPIDSDEYRALEDEVIRSFQSDLDHLEDLVNGAGE